MQNIMELIKGLIRDEEGATATEYAVMLALIIAVAIVTIAILGNQVDEAFNRVSQALTNEGITVN